MHARWQKSSEIWSSVCTPPARRDPAIRKEPIPQRADSKESQAALEVIPDLDLPFDSYAFPPRHDQEIMGDEDTGTRGNPMAKANAKFNIPRLAILRPYPFVEARLLKSVPTLVARI